MTSLDEKPESVILEERYKLIIENSNDLIRIFDKDFKFQYINTSTHFKQLGYTADELIGMHAREILHPEEYEEVEKFTQILRETGEARREGRVLHKEGYWLWFDISGKIITDKDKDLRGIIISRNITDRKKAEEKFKLFFKGGIIPTYAWQKIGKEFILIDFNDAAVKITEGGVDRFLGIKASEMYRNRPEILEDISRCFVEKTNMVHEMKYTMEVSKKEKDLLVKYVYIPPDLILVHTEDITDRKTTEAQIKESEEKYRTLSEQSFLGIAILQDDYIKYVNQQLSDTFGYTTEEILSWGRGGFLNIIYPEDRMMVAEQARKKQTGDLDVINQYQFRGVKKNGDIIWLEVFSKTINYKGNPADFVTIHDITDKKIAEQMIKESEEKYRTLSEQSFLGIAILQDDYIKYVNQQLSDTFGYTTEEIMSWGKGGFLNVICPEDRKLVAEQARRKQTGDLDVIDQYHFRGVKKNRDMIWLEVFSKTINYKGNPADFVTIHDITDKKKSEQKIKESEEKYRNLFNNAPFAIVLFNNEGVILDCNNATHKITGYSKEELIGNNFKSFNFYVDSSSAKLEERSKQTDQGKLPEDREIKLFRKDGTQFWAKSQIEFIKLKNETCIQAIIHDITDKKKSEIALNVEKKFVDDILNSSMDTIFVFNPATGKALRWNKVFTEVTGYTDEEIALMKAPYSYYFNEDLQLAAEATKKVLEGKKLTFEMMLITKDGRKIPYEYTGTTFTNSDGNVILVSIGRDLTERKEAEKKRKLAQKELEESYEKLQELEKIINNSPSVGILWKNAEGWPVEFVSENVNQWGYSPEDFYSRTVKYAEIIHPDDLEKVNQEVGHYSNEDINEFVQEYRIVTKSGEVKWIDDRTWIRRDSEGNITHFQGVIVDITDRKIAEEALKESERKFKKAYDQASFYKDLFTHDINNILQVVNSSAELISYQLGNSEKSKDISNIADIIKKQVDRGSKLVSNVRTLSIIEDEVISTKTIDFLRFLENSIDFIEKAYEERNVKISVDGLNGNYKIYANELIQDVFENILINAIKYNENPNVEIAIRLSKINTNGDKNFKIEFIDNGIGVPDDRKLAIFRSGNRELKGSKGMGLGLSLVGKIINLFKGRIWHEDKVKGDYTQGSNFIILLPEAE